MNAEIWQHFEEWADANEIGDSEDDWRAWFECWIDGFAAGSNYTGEGVASLSRGNQT